MAMNGTTMGDAIAAAIQTANPAVDSTQLALLKNYWEPIATAIVNHIKNNAALSVPALGISAPNGPCTGSSTTGTVT